MQHAHAGTWRAVPLHALVYAPSNWQVSDFKAVLRSSQIAFMFQSRQRHGSMHACGNPCQNAPTMCTKQCTVHIIPYWAGSAWIRMCS